MTKLSPRQLIFIKNYIGGQTAAQASRAAGYAPDSGAASRLLEHPLVIAEIEAAKNKIPEETKFDGVAAAAQLDEDREFARKTGNAMAAVRSTEIKCKLNGLLIERLDQRVTSGFSIVISGIDQPPGNVIEHEPPSLPSGESN
jgi:phage terminase small subunit